MIDFTTIQTFPVPASIAILNDTNYSLGRENKIIKSILIAAAIGSIIYIGYNYYKKQKENERK